MGKWELPEFFVDNFDDVELGYYEFVLAQAEKRLNETVRAGEGLTEKAFKLAGVTITVLTGCVIYLFSFWGTNPGWDAAVILETLACLACITLLTWPRGTYRTYVSGTSPKMLLDPFFFENAATSEATKKNVILNECIEYQDRIEENNCKNKHRASYTDAVLVLLTLSPLLLAVGHGIAFLGIALYN
jgi:hypothetical protein